MTAEILAATEHLVLRRMSNDDALAAYRSDPVQARYQSGETPYPLESTLMPHTTPSRLRELWAPCGHGTRTSRSKIKRHAVDLGIHRWGGWGSNPRPRDYESHALTG
jgi:hypothetical protein